jgi:acyl dehydratase
MTSGLHQHQVITVRRTMSAQMIRRFGELIGDMNPQHMNQPGGARPIVHGLYLASAVNTFAENLDILGRRFSMEFLAPAYAGDQIEVTITVTQVRPAGTAGDQVSLDLVYRNQNATTLARGTFYGLARIRQTSPPAGDHYAGDHHGEGRP